MIAGFRALHRELLLAVDQSLFDGIAGSADSELLFHLALTLGLENDPLRLRPDNERLQQLSEGDRVIVSEPLSDLAGAWIEIPESTGLMVPDGAYERVPFNPAV
jgi:hypothetical protein